MFTDLEWDETKVHSMVSYIVKRGKLCHFYAYLYTNTNLEEGDNLVTIPEKYAPSDIALLTMRYLTGITYIDGRGAWNAKKNICEI